MAAKYYYQEEISHTGLNKYRVIKAQSKYELQMKVNAQKLQWDEQWERKLKLREKEAEREAKRIEREARLKNDEDSQLYAMDLTRLAEERQQALDNIVQNRTRAHVLHPDTLKDFSDFQEQKPVLPTLQEASKAPSLSDEKYNPRPSFFTKLSKKKMKSFSDANIAEYEKDYNAWKQKKDSLDSANEKSMSEYKEKLTGWEKRYAEFKDKQLKANAEVDELFEQFQAGNSTSIERYIELLLGEIEFPFDYCIESSTEYNPDNKEIIVELFLPSMEDIPKLKSVSYIKTRKEFKETNFTDSYIRKKYDNIIYQIVLICLEDIFFIGKQYGYIENTVINGRIDTIDKATGKKIQPCVLSLSINNESFSEVNIDAIDPKVWFKSAKGVSAASIASITPIAPIVQLSKEDSRFIEGYTVTDQLNEGVNLAAIDWQDFENLIRELFEKEFSSNGGEVKITQASRDGGVDAVAFDPDPIRGGKIVIQAKRYTNVVGVSAVRDLYGTVLNEGANKGILVTTSNYGNDAYSFVQDKPLTLLNGANLLYLMEKHGYKARIDLKEAKELLKA